MYHLTMQPVVFSFGGMSEGLKPAGRECVVTSTLYVPSSRDLSVRLYLRKFASVEY